MKTTNEIKLDAIERFKKNQTLENLQKIRNLGIGLRVLVSNKWEKLGKYTLPFERFVVLYDDEFVVSNLGIY